MKLNKLIGFAKMIRDAITAVENEVDEEAKPFRLTPYKLILISILDAIEEYQKKLIEKQPGRRKELDGVRDNWFKAFMRLVRAAAIHPDPAISAIGKDLLARVEAVDKKLDERAYLTQSNLSDLVFLQLDALSTEIAAINATAEYEGWKSANENFVNFTDEIVANDNSKTPLGVTLRKELQDLLRDGIFNQAQSCASCEKCPDCAKFIEAANVIIDQVMATGKAAETARKNEKEEEADAEA